MKEIEIRKLLKEAFNISVNKRKIKELDITDILYSGDIYLSKDVQNIRIYYAFNSKKDYISVLKNEYPEQYSKLKEQYCDYSSTPFNSFNSLPYSLQNDGLTNYFYNNLKVASINKENKTFTVKNPKNKFIEGLPFVGFSILRSYDKNYYNQLLYIKSYLKEVFTENYLYFIDYKKNKKCYLSEYFLDENTLEIYPKADFVEIYNNRKGCNVYLLKSDNSIAKDYITGIYNLKENMYKIINKDGSLKYFNSDKKFEYYLTNTDFVPVFAGYDKYKSFRGYIENMGSVNFNNRSYAFIESKKEADEMPGITELKQLGIYIAKDDTSFNDEKLGYPTLLPYFNNIKKEEDLTFKERVKFGMESPTYIFTSGKRYTFGVELETATGDLPINIMKTFNLKSMRDGSIGGNEYVTGILKGDSGLMHLNNIISELNKRCTIDAKCGIHVHLGGAVFNKELLVTLYHLGLQIQEEMFAMLPLGRRNSKYCKWLEPIFSDAKFRKFSSNYNNFIEEYYRIMYHTTVLGIKDTFSGIDEKTKQVSQGLGPNNNKFKLHQQGRWNPYRYSWLNLQPAMVATKEDNVVELSKMFNIEFRSHSPSLNYKKIRNWILILMAVLSFAENRKRRILFDTNKITLKEILYSEFSEKPIAIKGNVISLPEYLNSYIEERKQLFHVSSSITEKEMKRITNDVFSEETPKVNNLSDLICV